MVKKNLDLHRHSQKSDSYFIEILGLWGTFDYLNGEYPLGNSTKNLKKFLIIFHAMFRRTIYGRKRLTFKGVAVQRNEITELHKNL